jgi:hypothetical protein
MSHTPEGRLAALERRKHKKIERALNAQATPSAPWQPRLKRVRIGKTLLNLKPSTPDEAQTKGPPLAAAAARAPMR